MFMSSTTIGKSILDKAWAATWDDGMTFAEQWMAKPKVIKTHLDEHRQFFKMLALALIYGMAPARMVKQCYEQFSYHMTLDEAQSIYDGYWTTFSGVRGLVNRLAKQAKKGYMYNEFGYRLTFDNTGERGKDTCHKAANFIIQSTVSGIMHLFNRLLERQCKFTGIPFLFVTVIHDETVLEVPVSQIEEFKEAKQIAVSCLNERLKWSVPISVGLAISDNFGGLK
jgi:DNA polymerase I-like protein with 3'-5' exonuclease and polymerase domains